MGKTYDKIPDNLITWIKEQEVFWVATAPLSGDGHVNTSPKGLRGTFHVENGNRGMIFNYIQITSYVLRYSILYGALVWYEDLTGSGALSLRSVFITC